MRERTRGQALRERRLRHGIKSLRAFSDASGVSREAITAAEDDRATDHTYRRLETWLDRFEEENDLDSDPVSDQRTVIVRLTSGDVVVAVQGPVTSLVELEAAAIRLLRDVRHPPETAPD